MAWLQALAALIPSGPAHAECTQARATALLVAIRRAADVDDGERLRPGVAPEGLPRGFARHPLRQAPLLRVTGDELSLHGTVLPPLAEGGGASIRESLLRLRKTWPSVGGDGPRPTSVMLLAPAALRAGAAFAPLTWSREGGFPDADLVVDDADEARAPRVSPEIRRRIAAGPPDRGRQDAPARERWAASLLSELAARCAFDEDGARDLVRAVFGIRRQGTLRVRLESASTPVIAAAPTLTVAAGRYTVAPGSTAGAGPIGPTRAFPARQARAAAGALAGAGGLLALRIRIAAGAAYGDVVRVLLALDEQRRGDSPLPVLVEAD